MTAIRPAAAVAAVMVVLCGVEATLAIGPAGTETLHMTGILTWLTWLIPPAVYLAGIATVWERRAQPRLYRAARQGLFGMSACLAVVAFCTSIELHPGLYPAAVLRAMAAGGGLVVLAVVFIPGSRADPRL